jgi:hypothetical protein
VAVSMRNSLRRKRVFFIAMVIMNPGIKKAI